MVTCRRVRSTLARAPRAGTGAPVVAFVTATVEPCTVTNVCAGSRAPALNGSGSGVAESPSAMVDATSFGSIMAL